MTRFVEHLARGVWQTIRHVARRWHEVNVGNFGLRNTEGKIKIQTAAEGKECSNEGLCRTIFIFGARMHRAGSGGVKEKGDGTRCRVSVI
jgi:hypothetical protein